MKNSDMKKLNQCLDILNSTDLGASLTWLWTWNTIKDLLEDGEFEQKVSEQTAWEELVKSIQSGTDFTLEYGLEQHYDHVLDWMMDAGLIADLEE